MEDIKLTAYSHGAGCGCKISPGILDEILQSDEYKNSFPSLLVGKKNRDDAAVYALDEKQAIISTTDFFMPIVDNPYDFGGIAAVNAISDIYAMGGKPVIAISILGWPVDKLLPQIARKVLEGAQTACLRAGIPLAGGHSIDTSEPIFGLAVTGLIDIDKIKSNNNAVPDCELYLTKPLGIGILTTAQKNGIVDPKKLKKGIEQMLALNDIGLELSEINGVKAMTDVTGFGLLGHLIEICEASGVSAIINYDRIPVIPGLEPYLQQKSISGGTERNFKSYGHKISSLSPEQKNILCDPQTSGGLLIAVDPEGKETFLKLIKKRGLKLNSFGKTVSRQDNMIQVF